MDQAQAERIRGWNKEALALRPGVELIVGANDQPMLRDLRTSRYVRLSRAGAELVRRLDGRKSVVEMTRLLGRHTAASEHEVRARLVRFLGELDGAGMLIGSEGHAVQRTLHELPAWRIPLTRQVDGVARPLAAWLLHIPEPVRKAAFAAIPLAAVVALSAAWMRGLPLDPSAVTLLPVAFLLMIQLVVHELAHAVSAQMCGVGTREAGLCLRLFFLPEAYVAIPDAHAVRARWDRAAMALAGPLHDFAWLLLASVALLVAPPAAAPVVAWLVLFTAMRIPFTLSPLRDSDGLRALEAFAGALEFRTRSLLAVASVIRRRELPPAVAAMPPRTRAWHLAYGTLAWLEAALGLVLMAAAVMAAWAGRVPA